jgi:ABC-2 type transport system permease protein
MGLTIIMGFLGGTILPLSMLPDPINLISWFLPYRYVFYDSISFIIGNTDQIYTTLGIQLVWIILLYFLFKLLWKTGLRKFDAVGG